MADCAWDSARQVFVDPSFRPENAERLPCSSVFGGTCFLLLIKTRKGNLHPHRVQYPTQQFFLVKEIWCQRIIQGIPIKIAIKLCRSNPWQQTHPKIIYRKCAWWYNYIFHHIPISYAISYSIRYATICHDIPIKNPHFSWRRIPNWSISGEAPWAHGGRSPRKTERLLWTSIAIEGFNDLTPQLRRFLQMSFF